MPTVALLDFEAPLPADPAVVTGDGMELRHGATIPLQSYRVEVGGAAQAYDDPAALLSDEQGRPAQLAMDLTWTTTGTPYAYRITTRYEIPAPSPEPSPSTAAPIRSRRLPGTRPLPRRARLVEHGLGVECPAPRRRDAPARRGHPHSRTRPGQRRLHPARGEPVVETTAVTADATFADNGLPVQTRIVYEPGPVDTTISGARSRAGAVGRTGRPGEPVPARLGRGRDGRRPARCRLGGVEPQPLTTGAPSRRRGRRDAAPSGSPPGCHPRRPQRGSGE